MMARPDARFRSLGGFQDESTSPDPLNRKLGVAVVFERKVALRNKLLCISYLRTPNHVFWTANSKIRGVLLFELSKVEGVARVSQLK